MDGMCSHDESLWNAEAHSCARFSSAVFIQASQSLTEVHVYWVHTR